MSDKNNKIVSYNDIISLDNLHKAWREFVSGKKYKPDVSSFQLELSRNIYNLHFALKDKCYVHGRYEAFSVNDPKPRSIHKASVRDRLLHHAIYRVLYPYFDKKFISDSYSCRDFKGTHRALDRFAQFSRKVSRNYTQRCWVLKCDIRKFFASVDHSILFSIIAKNIEDENIRLLLKRIIESFNSTAPGKGLPLGNLTSQLLVNVYMNEFDQYVKRTLKQKYYIRYADDFVIMDSDRNTLALTLPKVRQFLTEKLSLSLHPDKVFIKSYTSGIDFLGWVHFANHRVLRTSTKRRMLRRLKSPEIKEASVVSYRGMISHGNGHKIRKFIDSLLVGDSDFANPDN